MLLIVASDSVSIVLQHPNVLPESESRVLTEHRLALP